MKGILTWNSLEYPRPATARMDRSSNGFGSCESMVRFSHLALVTWHMFLAFESHHFCLFVLPKLCNLLMLYVDSYLDLNSISSTSTHLETNCSYLIFVIGCFFSPPTWCQQQGFYFPSFWWWPRWPAPWAFSTLELPSFRRWRLGRKMRDEDWRKITDINIYSLYLYTYRHIALHTYIIWYIYI